MNNSETPALSSSGRLDMIKLFRVVLAEIFGDGVMTGKELQILKNVREIIPIDPESYKKILGEIACDLLKEARTSDDDAEPEEIFRKCCQIVFTKESTPRDDEILLLKRLAQALNVPAESIQQIIDSEGKVNNGGNTSVTEI
ncbi:MAG: hypothetical protein CVV64_00340 [Candidatus Wallbacteria bacterium HGW-Wallbacteria-1]|jgi:energy-converting hydrogenase A subunit M|uniref:Uncharacterized protein n=1 Tax=Candidatus Wallbacteria bacterium HGW-Wallbacteria-1 TaxID=2013854 RepID=A0A2N1PU98_9BACT|nr:MAG: hypothetical protein CVV64_00340 [Candidatus Wallbacteria bacterium HGW-Wallbacteria-1]